MTDGMTSWAEEDSRRWLGPLPADEAEMVRRVRDLARASFGDGALKADAEGRLAVDSIRALHDIGFTKALLPASVGGGGMSCAGIASALAEMAYVDPSAAVAFNMHIVVAQYLSGMPFANLEPVFADMVATGATICGSASAPSTEMNAAKAGFKYVADGDSYVVNGKCGFASGVDAAKYIAIMGTIPDAPEATVAVAFPEVTSPGIRVLNNWNAMGLRGTASHDVVCENFRVKADDCIVLPVEAVAALVDQMPFGIVQRQHLSLVTLIGCWMGICNALMDHLMAFVKQRHGYLSLEVRSGGSDAKRAEEPWVRTRLGHMSYLLESGRLMLRQFADRVDGEPTTRQELQVVFARTAYHWKLTMDEFCTGAMRVAAAHGYVAGSPIERLVRDLYGCNVMGYRTDDLPRHLGNDLFGEDVRLSGLAGT